MSHKPLTKTQTLIQRLITLSLIIAGAIAALNN